jgi:hypothetical protein
MQKAMNPFKTDRTNASPLRPNFNATMKSKPTPSLSKPSPSLEYSPLRSSKALLGAAAGGAAESPGASLNDSPDHWRFYKDPYTSAQK